jgi:hypothetical protein
MKLSELAVNDQKIDELSVGGAAKAVGRGVGKTVGGVAKGIGAVAGGIAGIPGAVKKGFQAGKATVSGDPAPGTQPAAQPAAGTTPQPAVAAGAAQPTAGAAQGTKPADTGGTVGSGFAKGFAATTGAAQPAAEPETAQDAEEPNQTTEPQADQTTEPQADQSNQTQQDQQPKVSDKATTLKDRILKLDNVSQQDIVKLLQTQSSKASVADQTPDAATQARIDAAPQGYDTETGKPNASQDQKPTANFGQGGYGATTTNAPAGLTPPQPDPTKQATNTQAQTTSNDGAEKNPQAKKADNKLRDKKTGRYTKDHTADDGWERNVSQFGDSKINSKKSISESRKSFGLFRK